MSDQKSAEQKTSAEVNGDANKMDSEDLTDFVQNLLQQMHTRFQGMTDSIINRLDEMGERLNDLERSIGDITDECELDEARVAEEDEQYGKSSESCGKADPKTEN